MHLLIEASLNLKKYNGKDFMCLLIRFMATSSEAIYCTCLMHVWIEPSLNLKIHDGKDFMKELFQKIFTAYV